MDKESLKASLGRNLCAIRESFGYEPGRMAAELGVRYATYQNWERGTSYPQGDGIWHLANMGVNLNYLYLGVGPIMRSNPAKTTAAKKNRKATRSDLTSAAGK